MVAFSFWNMNISSLMISVPLVYEYKSFPFFYSCHVNSVYVNEGRGIRFMLMKDEVERWYEFLGFNLSVRQSSVNVKSYWLDGFMSIKDS